MRPNPLAAGIRRAVVPLALIGATAPATAATFFSEYVEGSSNNKALEIYSSEAIDLSSCQVRMYFNGNSSAGLTLNLSGSLAAGEVYVLAHSSAVAGLTDQADQTAGGGWFNGDDAVALVCDGTTLDVIGQIGVDPGSQWGSGDASTADNTLRRKASVTGGDGDGSDAFDPGLEWDGLPQNTFDDIGSFAGSNGGGGDNGGEPAPTPELTTIHAIQGSGASITGSGPFTVEAIVVGDYQSGEQLRGLFIQEEDADADADPATSEGLFVFCSACPVDVAVGDKVRVTGTASEFFDMSQLTAAGATDITVVSSNNTLPTPATVTVPYPIGTPATLAAAEMAINDYLEAFEGMLVTFPATLTVAEYFQLARYGEIVLSAEGRPRQFTDSNAPGLAGLEEHQIQVARRTVILDDDDNTQNSPLSYNDPLYHPVPGFSIANAFRGGDTLDNLTGVLHWSWAGFGGTDAWRIRPVPEAFDYDFASTNPRPAVPQVGGDLRVASFNVLNYFTSLDDGTCTIAAGCRGADSGAELARQQAKLVAAICEIDAAIVGLIEIENDAGQSTDQLVTALNGDPGCGDYQAIDTGMIGNDAIKVALIHQPASVSPEGDFAILDSSIDPNFLDDKNRPALAQTFQDAASGQFLTVVVNHLKSKGSDCDEVGDPDLNDGQGNCNVTRTRAAQAQVDWLATHPTGVDTDNVLILGDLNSYAFEDPIVALEDGGYTDLLEALGEPGIYTYVFDGQLGYLDYALASAALLPQVTGVAVWHINADEASALDYNDPVQDATEASFEPKPDALPLYEPNALRSSDHDPVIVGLALQPAAVVGDIDGDGSLGTGDFIALRGALGSCTGQGRYLDGADLDGDGCVTYADYRQWYALYQASR